MKSLYKRHKGLPVNSRTKAGWPMFDGMFRDLDLSRFDDQVKKSANPGVPGKK